MRAIISCCAISSVIACSDDGGGGGGGGGNDVAIDNLAAELGRVTCRKLVDCCTTEEFMEQTLGADNEMECVALYTGFGGIIVNVYKDSIMAGRLVYHADRMGDCLSKIEAYTCGEFVSTNEGGFAAIGCENPFEGTVAAGGQCANDVDCVSGWCSGDSVDFEGNITYGTCGTAPTAGMPCDDLDCGAGTYCEAGTCEMTKADGMACNSDDECTSGGCNGDPGVCGISTTCDGM